MVKRKKVGTVDIRRPVRIRPGVLPFLTAEQEMLRQMFGGGERTWGTGENLPRFDGALISGEGLIKSGDIDKETARMFGF